MRFDDGVDRRFGRRDVPVEEQAALLEREDAVGGIARLRKPRHDTAQQIDRLQRRQQRLRDARVEVVAARSGGGALDRVGRQVREPAILDEDRLAHEHTIEQIDGCRNRRTVRRVDVAQRMNRRREEVAVAAPAHSEARADVAQSAARASLRREPVDPMDPAATMTLGLVNVLGCSAVAVISSAIT